MSGFRGRSRAPFAGDPSGSVKFRVDHNLPSRLVHVLDERFPSTVHTMDLGFDRLPHTKLWEYAKDNGFHLITKDGDHFQLSQLRGAPPKVVWVRIGNAPAAAVLELILEPV